MDRVLVTGGNGYVAGWCIRQLLDAGYDVSATVRSPGKAAEVSAAAGPHDLGRLQIFQADLLRDEGWDAALEGCRFVLHTASPLSEDHDNPDAVIGPAVEGARRVLLAAARARVERIVLTSSCAAATPPSSVLTGEVDETYWTDESEPGLAPYRRSKVLAERLAWEIAGDPEFEVELTTVLPAAIFGPACSASARSSLQIIAGLLDGSTPALARLGLEIVDVRDVAAAHLLAMTSPAAVGERFIVAGTLLWLDEVAEVLRSRLGEDAALVPTEVLDDDVVRALAESMPELRSILPLLGRSLLHASTKARDLLGWDPRPAEETIVDSGRYLLQAVDAPARAETGADGPS